MALVLTRREFETVCIGNNITVSITRISGKQVRLSIDAPKDVAVHREEIYRRIKATENEPLGKCKALDT